MEFHSIDKSNARRTQTPAESLRQVLSKMENLLGKLNHSDKTELSRLPALFQQAHNLIAELDSEMSIISAEKVRFETLSGQLDRDKRKYIHRLGGIAQYQAISKQEDHSDNAWWWQLDKIIAEENAITRKNTLRNGALAIVIFIILAVLYTIFLRPDEATRTMIQFESSAETKLTNGDYAGALHDIEIALAAEPEETRLLVFRGVVHDILGDTELSEEDFDLARSTYDPESDFYVELATIYMTAQMPEVALQNANIAVEMNPDSPYAWYQVGVATNALGKGATAYKAFETAANLANEQEIVELEAISRMQMAYILQGSVENTGFENETDEEIPNEENKIKETTP